MTAKSFYPDSRPWTRWWWFNVELHEQDIRDQLRWLKDNGFGGVELAFVYPLPGQKRGPHFLSPEWSTKVVLAKRHCESLGLGCDFTFGTLWPFGGTFVSEADALQRFDGPSPQRLGRSWELPEEGRILNHLDREAFRRYADTMAAGFGEALGHPQITQIPQIVSGRESATSASSAATPRPGLFCDSFEVETEGLWTTGFGERFQERFGYDVRPFMPELDKNPDVRYDYRKLIAEYVLKEFYEPFTEFSHSHNSFTRVQCHGAPVDLLAAYAAADVPESEAILFDPEFSRIPASAAALAGKPVVSAEAFTCLYGWVPYPGPGPYQGVEQVADLKLLADALFANGVNQIFWHGMPYQLQAANHKPQVGQKYRFYASVHVGPDGSLAGDLPEFNAYMEKVCGAMKLGRPYSEVAVYMPIEDQWMKGDLPIAGQKPSAKYHWEMHYLRPPAELAGRQPFWVSTPFLARVRFEDGAILIGDTRFSLLYVDCEWIDSDGLGQVLRLAKEGLPVCLKRLPKRPGRVVDKRDVKKYESDLAALTGLGNVSSELAVLVQEPPLVSGSDMPDFWCRVVDDELLFFFGHPASRGLAYPIGYGQAAPVGRTGRDVKFYLGGSAPAFGLPIEFEPRQSLLLRVSGTGCVERLDIGYL